MYCGSPTATLRGKLTCGRASFKLVCLIHFYCGYYRVFIYPYIYIYIRMLIIEEAQLFFVLLLASPIG